MQEMPA